MHLGSEFIFDTVLIPSIRVRTVPDIHKAVPNHRYIIEIIYKHVGQRNLDQGVLCTILQCSVVYCKEIRLMAV